MDSPAYPQNPISSVTMRDYIRVLFRHKFVIVVVVVTVLLTVYVGLSLKTPVYEAQVKMLISAEKQVQSPYYRQLYGENNVKSALTQSEIVQSGPVIERTVQALKLYQKPLDYENNFASPLKIKITHILKKFSKEEKSPATTPEQEEFLRFRGAVDSLHKAVTVEPIRDTNLFTIKVQDFNPIGAAVTANVISRSYIIFDLEQQLADLTLKYGEKHPAVQQLKDSIEKMVLNLNGGPLSNIDAIGSATVKIIEQASVPLKPMGAGKIPVLVLSFMMSIFLSIVLAFIFDYLDPTIRSPQDIENDLKLPLLGSIPRQNWLKSGLIKLIGQKTKYERYFQILCDHLYLSVKDNKTKTILVTASSANEKASKITVNLGIFLSQRAGYNVLMLDADLAHPILHKILKVKNTLGFAEVLEGKSELKETILTLQDGFHLIPAGNANFNSMVLLDSDRANKYMNELRQKYDLVLVNCPNLKECQDAVVLSSYVDATVVVVNEGKTRRQVIKNNLQPLLDKKSNILGVILNNRTFQIPKFFYDMV